ncbi:MAG: hypothetical protein HJJLKODD_00828 [Phycisphaerae bacterium]|nr:hypothetical protein [Phycisphaerae bacterium]
MVYLNFGSNLTSTCSLAPLAGSFIFTDAACMSKRGPSPGAAGFNPREPDLLHAAHAVPTIADSPASWWFRVFSHQRFWAFLIGVAIMWTLLSATYEPGDQDSYYHIKMAALFPTADGGFPDRFKWLEHTILNKQQNVSHHYGFHILMMPFVHTSKFLADLMPDSLRTWAGKSSEWSAVENFKIGLRGWLKSPYILGGKALIILIFGAILAMYVTLLRFLDVGFRWFWILFFGVMPVDFLLRMGYIRAPSISLLVMLLIVYYCLQNKHWKVAIFGLLYCHLYGGFVFFPVIIAIWVLVQWVTWQPLSSYWRTWVYAIGGFFVGLLTNPYFIKSPVAFVDFYSRQILDSGLQVGSLNPVQVGGEWNAIDFNYWLQISAFVLVVLLLSFMIRFRFRLLKDRDFLFISLLNIFFLYMTFQSQRFIEYWPLFAVLNAAYLWKGYYPAATAYIDNLARLPIGWQLSITNYTKRVYVSLCIVLLVGAYATISQTRKFTRCKHDIKAISQAMNWFQENTPKDSLIFADDWDWFPIYYYYNHHNRYVCGLDPQFTNSMSPELWERYKRITRGQIPGNYSIKTIVQNPNSHELEIKTKTFGVEIKDICTYFEADYVIVDQEHTSFYRKLKDAPQQFEYVYPLGLRKLPPAIQPPFAVFRVIKPDFSTSQQSNP